MDEVQIPLGKGNGRGPVSQASDEVLERFVTWKREQFDRGEVNERYVHEDERALAAAEREIERRKKAATSSTRSNSTSNKQPPSSGEPTQASTPRRQAQQKRENTDARPQVAESALALVKAYGSAVEATNALTEAQSHFHLVTPAMVVAGVPEGFEVYTSIVTIDPYGREVYQITGDRKHPKDGDTVGIDRIALARIAQAAGASWLYSKRTDDGSHPHYCAWEAMIAYRLFDGQQCTIPGNVDIDVRAPHGPAYQKIVEAAKNAKAWENGELVPRPRDPEPQLLELRQFLSRHCESKAMNKAIGNMGIRRAYKRSELKKPFFAARLAFTGRSEDPEARRDFRRAITAGFLASTAALYGAPVVAPPQLRHAPPPPDPHAMPDGDFWGADYETEGEGV